MIAGETSSDVMTHFATGGAVVYALQYLKHAGWCPWLTDDTKKINLAISAATAIALACGVTGHWSPATGGEYHIPPLADLISNSLDAAKQFLTQQVLYDVTSGRQPLRIHREDLQQVAAALRDALTLPGSH